MLLGTPRAAPFRFTGVQLEHEGTGEPPPPDKITCLSFGQIKHLQGDMKAVAILGARLQLMGKSLILNVSDRPLAVVSVRRAVVLVLKEKAEIVVSNGVVFHSEHRELAAPSVARLRYYVHVPYRAEAALTRRAVFARDDWICQYCGRTAENLDHVVPRSRGGRHTWDNVVASCRRCNSRKENRLPSEAGLHPARAPFAPPDAFRLSLGQMEPDWEPYLA